MRFVQIGDLHLHPGQRNADRLAALDYVIDQEQARVKAWLFPGDLNHAGMSIDDRNALVARVLRMACVAPVVIVTGNHDRPGDLDFLAHLKGEHPIHVVTSPQVITLDLLDNGRIPMIVEVAIFCLPYASKASLVAAGTLPDQIGVVAAEAFDAIFMQAGDTLENRRGAGQMTLAIGHLSIHGAQLGVGQPPMGPELAINATHLRRLGDCFKGFNHIHRHHQVEDAWYAGSLCRLDWGETEPKGYLAITYTSHPVRGSKTRRTWTHEVEFLPVPVPPMYHVEATLTRDAFEWRCTKGPGGPNDTPPMRTGPTSLLTVNDSETFEIKGIDSVDWTGCDVRVRVRYAQAERDVLDTAKEHIRKVFAGARRFEVETIAETARELRAPEVVDAQTLDAKLRAWAKLTGVSWSDAIERCVGLLLSDDSVDVVAHVAADLEQTSQPAIDLAHDTAADATAAGSLF